ncbi:MAG: hypothetical protein JO147_04195 [Actinobacteria bacterium]|nr:hypothetical protein [Actinomycetota bacterium]
MIAWSRRRPPITLVVGILTAVLAGALVACSSKAPRVTASAPVSCQASGPCSTVGGVRWSVPLGAPVLIGPGNPLVYRTAALHDILSASSGPTMVVGWDATLRGFDLNTGRVTWTSGAAVPPGYVVSSLAAIGPVIRVGLVDPASGGAPRQLLVDPLTGRLRADLRPGDDAGAIWSDGAAVIAIESGRLDRIDLESARPAWTVVLDAARTGTDGASIGRTGVVAGGRVFVTGTVTGLELFAVTTGALIPTPTSLLNAAPTVAVGDRVVLDNDDVYEPATGRLVEADIHQYALRAVDSQRGVLYVSADGAAVRAVSMTSGRSSAITGITFDRLVAARDGTLVQELDDAGASTSPFNTATIEGRDPGSGKLRWTSRRLANFYALPSGGAWTGGGRQLFTDYVAGLTCAMPHGALAEPARCDDPSLTVLND